MTRRPHVLTVLPLLCVLFGTGAWASDIYRWTDAQGRVHYGDRAPASGAQKVVEPPPPSPLSPDEANAKLDAIRAKRATAAEEHAKAKEEKAKAQAEHRQRADECASARQQLDALRSAHRIRDENGEWHTGEQRLAKERELEKAIAKHCGGSAGQ